MVVIKLPGTSEILGKAHVTKKGYLRFHTKKYRWQYVHRVVWQLVADRPIPDGHDIHHIASKLCYCPWNFICLEKALHPKMGGRRCPYTGKFISKEELDRILGYNWDVPDWVMEDSNVEC